MKMKKVVLAIFKNSGSTQLRNLKRISKYYWNIDTVYRNNESKILNSYNFHTSILSKITDFACKYGYIQIIKLIYKHPNFNILHTLNLIVYHHNKIKLFKFIIKNNNIDTEIYNDLLYTICNIDDITYAKLIFKKCSSIRYEAIKNMVRNNKIKLLTFILKNVKNQNQDSEHIYAFMLEESVNANYSREMKCLLAKYCKRIPIKLTKLLVNEDELEILKILVENDCYIRFDTTLLITACEKKNSEAMVNFLFKHCLPPDDEEREQLLFASCKGGSLNNVKLFIVNNSKIKEKMLDIAYKYSYLDIIEYLQNN